jgi:GNAT superfamily N-acetyltransferase
MTHDCARKLKTGLACADVVDMCDGLWRGEENIPKLIFVNQPRCKYHVAMKLPDGFIIRRASADEIDTLVAHRRSMFRDMGHSDAAAMDRMAERCKPWLLEKMKSGEYLAWLAVDAEGTIAAGAGLWLMDWIPHMIGKSARRGNIINVYTEQKFRRLGLARRLMATALTWCRENGIDTIILHASAEGRALYESMGFSATNEMRIRL